MDQILAVIAPLFLIIFGSALLQRLVNFGNNWSEVLNEYALKIGFPVLIFTSLLKASFSFYEQLPLLISNSIFIIVGFLGIFLFGKMFNLGTKILRTYFICLIFGNVAYLGIPFLVQIFGAEILPVASLIVAVYLFWIFTIGIGFLDFTGQTAKKDIFKNIILGLFKNPLLVSVFLGILAAILEIKLPDILMTSLDMITASVTPTVLIVVGLFIGKSKIGELKEWLPILLFSLITLIAMPAIFYFGLKILGFQPINFSASVIQSAMPLAITPFALADKYGLDKGFIARSIVLSSILSVASLPFWISILTN